jgi:hypothetical protein
MLGALSNLFGERGPRRGGVPANVTLARSLALTSEPARLRKTVKDAGVVRGRRIGRALLAPVPVPRLASQPSSREAVIARHGDDGASATVAASPATARQARRLRNSRTGSMLVYAIYAYRLCHWKRLRGSTILAETPGLSALLGRLQRGDKDASDPAFAGIATKPNSLRRQRRSSACPMHSHASTHQKHGRTFRSRP